MVAYKERAPGVYRAVFKGVTDRTITNRETGEESAMWLWRWQETGDDTTAGELDTLTSPHFKSRSNGLRLLTGMLGRAPTEADNTEDLEGQEFDVVYGPNQNGRYTVTGATRPQSNPTSVVAGLPAVDTTPPGDLPF